MNRDLIIIVFYAGGGSRISHDRLHEVNVALNGGLQKMPDDIKDKYHVVGFVIPTDGENRMECVFPKDPDANTTEVLNQIIDTQKQILEWQQQPQADQ